MKKTCEQRKRPCIEPGKYFIHDLMWSPKHALPGQTFINQDKYIIPWGSDRLLPYYRGWSEEDLKEAAEFMKLPIESIMDYMNHYGETGTRGYIKNRTKKWK